jgi:hypothetical protein
MTWKTNQLVYYRAAATVNNIGQKKKWPLNRPACDMVIDFANGPRIPRGGHVSLRRMVRLLRKRADE